MVAPQAPLAGITAMVFADSLPEGSGVGWTRASFPNAASTCSSVKGRIRKSEAPARRHRKMKSGSLVGSSAITWTWDPVRPISSNSWTA